MKTNEYTVEKRLGRVPEHHRVFIYNAEIVIEFLNHTFMPTRYFLKPGAELGPAIDLDESHLADPDALDEQLLDLKTLYDYYRLFREAKAYTAEIETEFKFKVILGKMRLLKNGWEFFRIRKGRGQTVFYAPLVLRAKVPTETREQYPIVKTNVSEGQVPTELQDFQEEEEDLSVLQDVTATQEDADRGMVELLKSGTSIEYAKQQEPAPASALPNMERVMQVVKEDPSILDEEPNVWDEINGEIPGLASPEPTDY